MLIIKSVSRQITLPVRKGYDVQVFLGTFLCEPNTHVHFQGVVTNPS